MTKEIDFDPAKDSENRNKHGLSLSEFPRFDEQPVVVRDRRRDFGEARYRAFGRIGGKGYMVVFTTRSGTIRMISFRRAHDKEMRRYE